MKKLTLYLSFILTILLFIAWTPISFFVAIGEAVNNDDLVIEYSENIKTDSILVTLSTEETRKFKSYTAQDFDEVACTSIEDLTADLSPIAKSKLENNTDNGFDLLNVDEFKTILKLNIIPQSKTRIFELVNQLNKRADIYSASPNYIYYAGSEIEVNEESNDITNEQWALYGENNIQVEDAWKISTGSPMVSVGIMDTGIQGDHEDLRLNVNTNNGDHRSFINGINESDPLDNIADPNGHGTHIAGIIGATNNDFGVNGVCKEVNLISLKVFDELLNTSTDKLASAIQHAETENIPILNFSGGWLDPYNVGDDITLKNALSSYNGLFVCIAGNQGTNIDSTKFYPAEYSYNQTFSERIIAVGALNSDTTRRESSNYGQNSVSIYAPGTEILSTFPLHLCQSICSKNDSELTENQLEIKEAHVADGYHYMSGTSMAAPHVAGVAALLLSNNPDLTAAQLKTAILNGSDEITIEIPDGDDDDATKLYQEVKKLNATKALAYAIDNFGRSTTLKYNSKQFSEEIFEDSGYILSMDVQNNYTYRFTLSSASALNVILYDANFNEIAISTTITNEGCNIQFNEYLSIGKYYLWSNFIANDEWGDIDINIQGQYHAHSYTDRYEAALLNHRAYCECGEYQLKPHVVRVGISGADSTCALCGALVPTTIGGLNSIQATATYVTLNGSFIAQNGIIYLVDADWDAYFAGTLQFYLNTNLPIVTNRVAIYGEGRL